MNETWTAHLIEQLSRPEAYPFPVTEVDTLQTHISVLFFAADLVFKVKKPVDLEFLDFTGLDRRRHYCHEEIRLNADEVSLTRRRRDPNSRAKVIR